MMQLKMYLGRDYKMDNKKIDYVIKRLKELQLCCDEQNAINSLEDTYVIFDIIIKEVERDERSKKN